MWLTALILQEDTHRPETAQYIPRDECFRTGGWQEIGTAWTPAICITPSAVQGIKNSIDCHWHRIARWICICREAGQYRRETNVVQTSEMSAENLALGGTLLHKSGTGPEMTIRLLVHRSIPAGATMRKTPPGVAAALGRAVSARLLQPGSFRRYSGFLFAIRDCYPVSILRQVSGSGLFIQNCGVTTETTSSLCALLAVGRHVDEGMMQPDQRLRKIPGLQLGSDGAPASRACQPWNSVMKADTDSGIVHVFQDLSDRRILRDRFL